jgi:hypothetical protein
LDVYPNPVDNELNVRLDKQIQAIKILNVLGQTVYSAENIGLYNVKINFSGPAAGLYLGVVTDINGNKSMFKTLKQ